MRRPSTVTGDAIMDSESEVQAQYRADADDSVSCQVVVGDRKLVVRAEGGSSVTVQVGEPPRVERRTSLGAGPQRPRPLGREYELAAIVQALDDGLVVQIHGSDGSGRSTVLRYLAQVRGDDRDVVFLTARGLAIDDLLQTLFDACFDSDGYRPEPSRMRELMGTVRALLLVDDFDGTAEDLKALLDTAPAGEIVVASRERIPWSGGFAVELGGLTEADGVALLARELDRNLEADEEADAVELWRAAGGNPLALVQVAAAVRQGIGTLAGFRDSRDSQQLTRALVLSRTEPQRQVLGILSLIGAVPAPAALLTAIVGPPCEAAIEQLVAAGLVTEGQPRLAGPLGEHVAALAGTSVAPARLAETITAWLAAGTDRRLLGESAPPILQVLRATMAAGNYPTAVRLARVASPKLAMALHLGAWGTLLELGRSAALATNAAGDEAYVAHEAAARLQSLGKAAAAEALVGTPAVPPTQLIDNAQTADLGTMQAGTPPAPAVQPPAVPGRGNIRTAVAKPAVWVVVIAAAIAGTIAFTAFDADDPQQAQAAPAIGSTIAPTTSTPPVTPEEVTSTPEPTTLVTTSVPIVTSTSARTSSTVTSTSAASAASVATSTAATAIPPPECASSLGAVDFGAVAVFASSTVKHSFHSPRCHPNGLNTGSMSIRGTDPSAFSFSPGSCPEVITPDGNTYCTIAVTFQPDTLADFTAEIYVPAADGNGYGSIRLYGRAAEAIFG
jgi:hypothetical protein